MKQIIIFLSVFFPFFLFAFEPGFNQEYYQLSDKERRKVFIEKIDRLLDVSFETIKKERAFIEELFSKHEQEKFANISEAELSRLMSLKTKYRINNLFDFKEYKRRINTVPKSMAIAQAIVESATGTSRFAKEANNLFGEWTWGEKGLIPKQRKAGKTHKIKIFDSLQESVDSYLLNLNRHNAYKEFREKREQFSQNGKKFTGLEVIQTLQNYSEKKGEYAKILKSVIEQNKLYLLD